MLTRTVLPLTILGLLAVHATACDQPDGSKARLPTASPSRAAATLEDSDRVGTLLSVLDSHDGVVTGVVEVRTATGAFVESRAVNKAPVPPNVADLMEMGGADNEGFAYYDVAGAQGDGDFEVRYRYIRRHTSSSPRAAQEMERDFAPPTDEARLLAFMNDPEAPPEVEVYIRLEQTFSTRLKPASARGLTSLLAAQESHAARIGAIEDRKSEATTLQASTVESVAAVGGRDFGGYWTSNAISAVVPTRRLVDIARFPGVSRVEISVRGTADSSTQWDGADMKSSSGLNASVYHNAGYHGQAYQSVGGRHMRVAMIGTEGYWNHPGFLDGPSSPSRATVYDCSNWPCIANQSIAGVDGHDLKCGGLAAGSLRQGQISGLTGTEELERTGVAEEPEVYS